MGCNPSCSLSDLLSVQPDLTQTVVTIQNHHTLDTPNNNHLGSMEKMPVYAEPMEIMPNLPNMHNNLNLLIDPSSPHKTNNDRPRKESDCESRPNSVYSERTNRQSMISCQLPSNIDMEALVYANVTHSGGRITIPDAGELEKLLSYWRIHGRNQGLVSRYFGGLREVDVTPLLIFYCS